MNARPLILAIALAACTVAQAQDFTLTSPDIAQNRTLDTRQVFKGFGCDGGNTSPALAWSNAPAGTKSFAITVYDPDAPTGSGWWHWTVVNLPATTTALPAGVGKNLPAGAVQGRSDFGSAEFGGACPPVGDKPHRYQFTVWALKADKLPLDDQASGALVGYMLNANVLAKATITALYGR
jgi:Raf kinase inhibitor-like YbhB/YbcL family protein